ncbi:glycosyltransferase [Enterobacter pseudoroggenkampii]|jgi:Glycosyltransferases involved in cell wall biogenesis|uniref:glycosyltransferase n=1 Tax=Enterobacter pseudoroggenkampii TaxID=2996112 RepID=UPI00200450E9|nr:glycosyltransferase [Enterobacter roggenkampii]
MVDLELGSIITVSVICYNSEKTISETLNSIADQTYNRKAIEVIISDDCSKDSSLSIAEEWKKQNLALFKNIIIVSHNQNRGVAANCNQAWRLATGSWIKTIAADDVLLPNCIELNVNYVNRFSDSDVVFSDMIAFSSDGQYVSVKQDKTKILVDQKQQLKNILSSCYLLAPTAFIRKQVLELVGYADESYPMIEDYPLWLKCLQEGFTFSYLEADTVLYRKGDSLSQQGGKIGNVLYLKSLFCFQKEQVWPLLPPSMSLKKWDDYLLYKHKMTWINLFGNKVTLPFLLSQKILFLFRPYKVFCAIKRLITK